jgi:hypothetical protein
MTSMPEVAAEWQNFDQLAADKLYELLRFRHDLCDSKRFLELGCTIPGTIYNPFLAGNRKFESASLQGRVGCELGLTSRMSPIRHADHNRVPFQAAGDLGLRDLRRRVALECCRAWCYLASAWSAGCAGGRWGLEV